MNIYAKAKDQRLADVVDKVADQVTFDQFGADVLHKECVEFTTENAKLLVAKEVIRGKPSMEPGGIEPPSTRCDRVVIPLHHGP